MGANTAANSRIPDSLKSLVDRIANIELQMASIHGENKDLRDKPAILEGS
jgi:hypothetical protein